VKNLPTQPSISSRLLARIWLKMAEVKEKAAAVGRPVGVQIPGRVVGEACRAGAVGVHDVDHAVAVAVAKGD
jgi:hypothetical protein